MKAIEIVKLIRDLNPNLAKKTPDETLIKIINVTMKNLRHHIDLTNEGIVRVPNLGIFNIKQVEREKEGNKIMVKRVLFKAMTKSIPKDQIDNE